VIAASRVARPTADLAATRPFYEELVGLRVLAEFADHDGFDGVIFGLPDERSQLELVHAPGDDVVPNPSVEDQLVLYFDAEPARQLVRERLVAAGFPPLAGDDPSLNPYWTRVGAAVFVDPDGYRLVLAPFGA
jgi:catechol 2,3-dioxygenase-like lactoylglutathione lyase family enzyme